ncbi:MAG: UDP-N-acetylmuramate--L-alanine ligase [Cyanobacteria bacterium P01_A01_bin.135]
MGIQVDFTGRPFHFIGIGGIGMSAIAHVLLEQKLSVSGSDKRLNHITQRLQEHGACIFEGQTAENLAAFSAAADAQPGAPTGLTPQVICSTAISKTNPEYRAAIDLNCPIFHRSDVLAGLMQRYRGLAVAGTHGKTTTTSMIGYVLLKAGLDPTILVGGEVSAWQGNARVGSGPFLLAEADESDGSLVKFSPQIGVITNIELDHPDHYSSIDDVVRIFRRFADQAQILVACADCDTISKTLSPTTTYSINAESLADYRASDIHYGERGTSATVWERNQPLGQLNLQVLGAHNLSNSLAAVAVGRLLGLPFAVIAEALNGFEGARRRYELKGEANQITFIDDYAHHPSEIQVTLAAARLQAQNRRIVAIFQPHRYSRTLTFLNEFSQAFAEADQVVLTDIYAAGEAMIPGISGKTLAEAIKANHAGQHGGVSYQPTLKALSDYLSKMLRPGDVALFLGAGNLNQIIPDLIAFHRQCSVQHNGQPLAR